MATRNPMVKKIDDMFSRMYTIPAYDGQTSCDSIVRAVHTVMILQHRTVKIQEGGGRNIDFEKCHCVRADSVSVSVIVCSFLSIIVMILEKTVTIVVTTSAIDFTIMCSHFGLFS